MPLVVGALAEDLRHGAIGTFPARAGGLVSHRRCRRSPEIVVQSRSCAVATGFVGVLNDDRCENHLVQPLAKQSHDQFSQRDDVLLDDLATLFRARLLAHRGAGHLWRGILVRFRCIQLFAHRTP